MKTQKKYQIFANELELLCEKHGVYLIGTCESEGIYGEITLVEKDDPECSGWAMPLEQVGFVVSLKKFPHLTKRAADASPKQS